MGGVTGVGKSGGSGDGHIHIVKSVPQVQERDQKSVYCKYESEDRCYKVKDLTIFILVAVIYHILPL